MRRPRITRSMSAGDWGMLIALAAVWGGSFFFVEVAVREVPTLTIVAIRVGLAALILSVFLYSTGQRLPSEARIWRAFFAMGLLNNVVPFSLIVWGQHHIASGLASILNATTPLFAVLIAHLFTADEKLTAARLAGVAVGFAGVVVMIGPAALGEVATNFLAQLACLAAAVSYAVSGVFGRRFGAMGVAPIVTAAGMLASSAVMLLPVALVMDQPWSLPAPGPASWACLIGLATLSTAFAYILYFRILASAGATNLLLVTFLVPVSAILLGSLVLGERLEPEHFAGMGLIGLGLAAIDGRMLTTRRTMGIAPRP